MKVLSHIVLFFLVAGLSYSCKKDNFSAPNAQLSGALLYNGDTIYVQYDRVPFQLYQYGFGKVGPIGGTFGQDGTISALLFNGDYKFLIPNGQGPFLWPQTTPGIPDTVNITISGSQQFDVTVTPYYMVRNTQVTGGSGTVSATFSIEKIITDANAKDIESATLYINRTQFVSGADNVASTTVAGADITNPASVSLSVAVPTLSQTSVFARVGVKVAGVEDMIFSKLVQVTY